MPTRGEIAAVFDAIAEEFEATRTRPWPETRAFAAELPPVARVLDLGCGGGRNLAVIAEGGRAVVGLDASASLLAFAAVKRRGVVVRGDAANLPFAAGAFDAVHCVAALHHLPSEVDRRQTVGEIARVLRSGGLALLSVWALEQDRFRTGPADVEVPWRRSDGRAVARFYHLFRAGELDDLAMASGLVVGRAWRERENHVVLAAKR